MSMRDSWRRVGAKGGLLVRSSILGISDCRASFGAAARSPATPAPGSSHSVPLQARERRALPVYCWRHVTLY
jgi:hypothetical protein